MRRPALLMAGAMLWLFLAAIPVLADGGIHVAGDNSGLTTLTADGCAGCHRAHTGQGEFLLKEANANTLCLSCHGSASNGATVDVMTGVQYKLFGGLADYTTQIGALRDGGFAQARIDSSNPARIGYYRAVDTVSFRAKVGVGAATNVTSAHLDLDGLGKVVAKDVAWGNGAAGTGAGPSVQIECTSCHNPHGNGQYRILNTLPAATGAGFVDPVAIPISGVSATTGRFTTSRAHGLIVGDIVTISGVTGAAPSFNTAAQYIVKSIPNGVTFTVAAAPTKTSADISGTAIAITTSGTGGTVQRFTAIVDDAPLASAGDERNYTILQVMGTQGTNASYMLYASDVLDARSATPVKTWPAGDYSATGGDYFHRTVPWNPTANNPTCLPTINTFPLPAACTTANDAPNGRPATSTTLGQVAFNDQISAWCSTCHSRYYSSTNPNPGGEPGSSTDVARSVSSIDLATETITLSGTLPGGGTITSTGFSVGDVVRFSATPSAPDLSSGTWYVVYTSSLTFRVSATYDGAPVDITGYSGGGTVIRTAPAAASSWWFPRPGETLTSDPYKYQHQTTTNRSCVTCHVSHGSDAAMGTVSGAVAYPGGSAATAGFNSRLLKVNNRGTCQMCHDPTGTATAGTLLPSSLGGTPPSVP